MARSFTEKLCVRCGKLFTPNFANSRYCSKFCSGKANCTGEVKNCIQCLVEFTSTGAFQKFCGRVCSLAWNLANPPVGPKVCKDCKDPKPMKAFVQSPLTGYYQSSCIACMNVKRDARRAADPVKFDRQALAAMLWRKYSISIEEYDAMALKQNHRCAICGSPPVGKRNRLCVDHCHTSGDVRGLLCNRCNTAIGMFKDDGRLMLQAIRYVGGNDLVDELLEDDKCRYVEDRL